MGNRIVTGMAWTGSSLGWTCLRAGRKRPERLDSKDVSCAFPAPALRLETPFDSPENIAELKKAVHGFAGEISMALPAGCVMLRIVELPTTDLAELQGMAELQVDKYCPFPLEHVQFSFEVLQKTEHASRVLVAAVQNNLLDGIGLAMRKCGIIPHRVDVDLPARWRLIHASGQISEHGQQVILLADENDYSLLVAHHGIPVLFRSLGPKTHYVSDEACMDLLEEIRLSLTAIEAEWPAAEMMKLLAWSDTDLPQPLQDHLPELSPLGAECRPLSDLPALSEGIAQRALLPEKELLNLAPANWGEVEHFRDTAKKMGALTTTFLVLWIAAMAGLIVYFQIKDREFRDLEAGREEILRQTAAIREIKSKVRSLREYSDRSRSALECLRELSILLPPSVDFTSMTYRKGRDIDLRGVALTAEPIHDFIAALEGSELFTAVNAENILTRRVRDQLRNEFSVKLELPGEESP